MSTGKDLSEKVVSGARTSQEPGSLNRSSDLTESAGSIGEVREIPVADISVGDRHRKKFGELKSLGQSISEIGLLQPIGIDASMNLVFGERRLRAVRDELKLEKIACRIVDLDDPLRAEHDENELTKPFTKTERDAIRRALKDRLEKTDRRGKVANCPHLREGDRKTRVMVAKEAGFSSEQEARRVAKVVEKGVPELAEMMDGDEVSVSAAAEIASLPEKEQQKVVASGPKEVRKVAKTLRETRARPRPRGHTYAIEQILVDLKQAAAAMEEFKVPSPTVASTGEWYCELGQLIQRFQKMHRKLDNR